jgi:hypothetical protein
MKQTGNPFLVEKFYCDGRGPELTKIHWAYSGRILRAIDFINPDEVAPKHLFFEKVQVYMHTPEEVIDYRNLSDCWITYRPAGILCFGQSTWLRSYAPRHLAKCSHYQIMFYDELIDVICENIEVRDGKYMASTDTA